MSFKLDGSLRRIKPQRRGPPLTRRAHTELTFVTPQAGPGPELLLDATVYIDVLQGRTPPEVDRLLQLRIANHSAIVLGELTHLLGRLDPRRPDSKAVLAEIAGVIEDMPAHRLSTPSIRTFAEAGMLAGVLARLGGRPHTQLAINDALVLLDALDTGRTVLTANISDFDLLQQLVPQAEVLFYRKR